MLTHLLLANDQGIMDVLAQLFEPIFGFFKDYGEIGLFIYSIIETITPLAGVEIILFPLLLSNPERWWFITLNLVVANTIGSVFVYFFMAKEENKFYNRIVSKKYQLRAKKLFDRYGVWAIFIFAMTPLPFFVIIFTAAIARMKFRKYVLAVFLSRGIRFYITSYAVVFLGGQGNVILWLAVIGVSFALIMMYVQKRALTYFEKEADKPKREGENAL